MDLDAQIRWVQVWIGPVRIVLMMMDWINLDQDS